MMKKIIYLTKKYQLYMEIDMEDEYVYNKECVDCGDMTCAEVCFFYKDETYCEDCCPQGYGD